MSQKYHKVTKNRIISIQFFLYERIIEDILRMAQKNYEVTKNHIISLKFSLKIFSFPGKIVTFLNKKYRQYEIKTINTP